MNTCNILFSFQVFKLLGSSNCYLYVVDSRWAIRSNFKVKDDYIMGANARNRCPAHPVNTFSRWQNSWMFKSRHGWEEGGVVLQCSVHDDNWLLEQGLEGSVGDLNLSAVVGHLLPLMTKRKIAEVKKMAEEGQFEKERVQAFFCEESKHGTPIVSLLDVHTQRDMALWNKKRTIEVAHLMSGDFHKWLIHQATEGMWSKEEVGNIVCRKNADNQLILATLDGETLKQAAALNKAKTCSAVPYMDDKGDFLQWLYEEAEKGHWDQTMVFAALAKEDVDGKSIITTRRKKCNQFLICKTF